MKSTIRIYAKFIYKKTSKPVTGDMYMVKLYDNDIVSDDFLGEGKLDSEGGVEILVDLKKAYSFDSPLEKNPDLYFELFNQYGVIFQSKVFKNFNLAKRSEKVSEKTKAVIDFGTFEID
jgi:hypothetical protein